MGGVPRFGRPSLAKSLVENPDFRSREIFFLEPSRLGAFLEARVKI